MRFSLRPSAFYTLITIVPVTIVLALFLVLFSPIEFLFRYGLYRGRNLGPVAVLVRTSWLNWICWSQGLKIRARKRIETEEGRGLIIVSNHLSLLDIPLLYKMAPTNTIFLAKKELLFVPFFGWAAWLAGTQFVDRKRGAKEAPFDEAMQLLSKGFSLVVFPEGTRSAPGELLPFKRGAAMMALKAKVDILPVAIAGSELCLSKKSLAIHPGYLDLAVGQKISIDAWSYDRRAELTEKMRNEVLRLQNELRSLKTQTNTPQ